MKHSISLPRSALVLINKSWGQKPHKKFLQTYKRYVSLLFRKSQASVKFWYLFWIKTFYKLSAFYSQWLLFIYLHNLQPSVCMVAVKNCNSHVFQLYRFGVQRKKQKNVLTSPWSQGTCALFSPGTRFRSFPISSSSSCAAVKAIFIYLFIYYYILFCKILNLCCIILPIGNSKNTYIEVKIWLFLSLMSCVWSTLFRLMKLCHYFVIVQSIQLGKKVFEQLIGENFSYKTFSYKNTPQNAIKTYLSVIFK